MLRDEPAIEQWIDPADLERILDPERYLGDAAGFVSRVLAKRSAR